MSLERENVVLTVYKAVHEGCGAESVEVCGAHDMHMDTALDVVEALEREKVISFE